MAAALAARAQVPRGHVGLAPPLAAAVARGIQEATDARAAPAADELVVLAAHAAARAEEERLDRRPGDPQAIGDPAVGEPLELAQHEHVAMRLRQPVECTEQQREPLADLRGVLGGVAAETELVGIPV